MIGTEITGTLTLTSPLHIGGNADYLLERDDKRAESGTEDAAVAHTAMAFDHTPCIPGSSLKGVLRAWAKRSGVTDDCIQRLFGDVTPTQRMIGGVQFLTSTFDKFSSVAATNDVTTTFAANTFTHTRHARDRKTKAVENQKLFTKTMVADGAQFQVRLKISGKNIEESHVQTLLWLLSNFNGQSGGITLGAATASGNGAAKWSDCTVKKPKATFSWTDVLAEAGKPERQTVEMPHEPPPEICAEGTKAAEITLNLEIPIDGPFLSFGGNTPKTTTQPEQFTPRRTRSGTVMLDASSLRGALRSQAERICRTVGIGVEGNEMLAHLFGTQTRKSALTFSHFYPNAPEIAHHQEFVAIDRFTGGAAAGAKFHGKSILNPTLVGTLTINRTRLGEHENAALGLLLLTLRDLDEGDIPLGYGAAAKGYGQVKAGSATATVLTSAIAKCVNDSAAISFLQAFRTLIQQADQEISGEAFKPITTPNGVAVDIQKLEAVKFNPESHRDKFHNPYLFVPLGALSKEERRNRVSVDEFTKSKRDDAIHHWHDKYAIRDGEMPVYSGRIICKITAKTPLVLGSSQMRSETKTQSTEIKPAEMNGLPYIPATSLRGMLSSFIEILTNSAPRVLENQPFSVRMTAENCLPKKGLVANVGEKLVVRDDDGGITYDILEEAIENLYLIGDQRALATDGKFPEVKGKAPFDKFPDPMNKKRPRLARNQKVFFELGETQVSGKVTQVVKRIAWSQIWREPVKNPSTGNLFTAHDLFSNLDPELVPFNSKRSTISPAEWLFGFAAQEVSGGGRNKLDQALSFAGKLNISKGVLPPAAATTFDKSKSYLSPIRLKILATPKPPSPAMYLKHSDGEMPAHVAKVDFARSPKSYVPKGVKMYGIHARTIATREHLAATKKIDASGNFSESGKYPWETHTTEDHENNNQRATVTPICEGTSFYFHIDFVNLSQSEFELLCFALYPSANPGDTMPKFEHRLGMGKSLGLGCVRIEPRVLALIDRHQRYGNDAPCDFRHSHLWTSHTTDQLKILPNHYQIQAAHELEGDFFQKAAIAGRSKIAVGVNWVQQWITVRTAITPTSAYLPTITPQLSNQDCETENFKWFVENERSGRRVEDREALKYPINNGLLQGLNRFVELTKSAPKRK